MGTLEKKQLNITRVGSDGKKSTLARVIVKPYGITFIPRDMMVEYSSRGTYVRYRRDLKVRMDRFERLCRELVETRKKVDFGDLMAMAHRHNEQLPLSERTA